MSLKYWSIKFRIGEKILKKNYTSNTNTSASLYDVFTPVLEKSQEYIEKNRFSNTHRIQFIKKIVRKKKTLYKVNKTLPTTDYAKMSNTADVLHNSIEKNRGTSKKTASTNRSTMKNNVRSTITIAQILESIKKKKDEQLLTKNTSLEVNFEKNGLTKEQQSLASFVASMSSKQSSGRTVFNNKKKIKSARYQQRNKKRIIINICFIGKFKKNFKIQEEYKKQNKPVPETLKKKMNRIRDNELRKYLNMQEVTKKALKVYIEKEKQHKGKINAIQLELKKKRTNTCI